jgi:hypothetical protein
MSRPEAQGWVTTSAVIVAGVFAYRKLMPGSSLTKGSGPFVVGWMVVYVTLSVVAQAAPQLGAMFAGLVALGDVLTNGNELVKDLQQGLVATKAATSPATSATTPQPETS